MIIPDVSFYQYKYFDNTRKVITKYIDFAKMRTLTPAVIIRGGQNLWRDIAFHISWKNAKDAGLLRGAYWFYDSRANPKRQAEKFAEVLGNDTGEMELWMDFEDRYGGDFGKQQDWYDFAERLKVLLPHKQLGVYTGYYYWMERVTSINKYFAQYPLWLAWYNPPPPLIPKDWKDWLYWQYTDNGDGKKYGVESHNIDLNFFNGSDEDFVNRYTKVNYKADLVAKIGDKEAEYRRV